LEDPTALGPTVIGRVLRNGKSRALTRKVELKHLCDIMKSGPYPLQADIWTQVLNGLTELDEYNNPIGHAAIHVPTTASVRGETKTTPSHLPGGRITHLDRSSSDMSEAHALIPA